MNGSCLDDSVARAVLPPGGADGSTRVQKAVSCVVSTATDASASVEQKGGVHLGHRTPERIVDGPALV